jgi:hypothetical protein
MDMHNASELLRGWHAAERGEAFSLSEGEIWGEGWRLWHQHHKMSRHKTLRSRYGVCKLN